MELTERASVLRVDVSIDSVTDTSFFKFKKALDKKALELRDDRAAPFDKIKRPRSGAASILFQAGFLGATEANSLAGGAQIVG